MVNIWQLVNLLYAVGGLSKDKLQSLGILSSDHILREGIHILTYVSVHLILSWVSRCSSKFQR